ncbi:MAG: glycerate kinase [Salinibacter sp.]
MASSSSALEEHARDIFDASVRRVQADRVLDANMASEWAPRPLSDYDEVRVVGVGKAAMAMAAVVESTLSGRRAEGVAVVPAGYPAQYPAFLPLPETVQIVEGGHPLPTEASARAGRRLREHAQALGAGSVLLVAVSGGGTALSSLPVSSVDGADLRTTYHRLLTAGVPIEPANVVRKHLTQVGGGQLAQAAHPAHVGALVVSDVVGDDLATIASGPTVPDPSTYEDAMRVLYRHDLWHTVPASVREHLAAGARGTRSETPHPGAKCFETSRCQLVGTNETALAAAQAAAEDLGYTVRRVTPGVEGEARRVGQVQAETLIGADVQAPTCWIWGGETTVTVTGDGMGGRNQELALGAALTLDGAARDAVLLSGGTDGIDGPTDAAGAWATPDTAQQARAAGCDPRDHLDRNDAYPLFDALGHLLCPGPTHTNVMDVQVGLVHPDH